MKKTKMKERRKKGEKLKNTEIFLWRFTKEICWCSGIKSNFCYYFKDYFFFKLKKN